MQAPPINQSIKLQSLYGYSPNSIPTAMMIVITIHRLKNNNKRTVAHPIGSDSKLKLHIATNFAHIRNMLYCMTNFI